jgi:thioredoxin-like negative regulator of GroEL
MTERLIILVLLIAAVTLAVRLVSAWNAGRVRQLRAREGNDLLESLGQDHDGRRTLVTFSTPSCAACHAAQAPAVSAVERRLGSEAVRVIRVDAARSPDVARAFGVLTVPSTVVLAPTGQLVAHNHGFASTTRLLEQLQST